MSLSFEQILWRNALVESPAVPDAVELISWARLFDDDEAELLRNCAALQQGFSSEALTLRGSSAGGMAQETRGSSEWGAHAAIAELREISRQLDPAPRLSEPEPALVAGERLGMPASVQGTGCDPSLDLAATARELVAIFGDTASPDLARLTQLMRGLAEAGQRRPVVDYRRYADAAMPLLAGVIAATCLCDFALRTRDLSEGPLGSPKLLHRAARFSSGGLGPYFGNVGHLARGSRDVFDLARIAAGAVCAEDEGSVGAWIAILSRCCEGPLLHELTDDLGDYAAHGPLSAILDRTLSNLPSEVDLTMVARVRDAALDNGNALLAARAQAGIARLRPGNLLEQEILGDIYATGGNLIDALATYRACLLIDPVHEGVQARLRTLGTAAFAPFLIERGFGSPPDRAATRLYRRGVPPRYAQRRGAVIHAVDVA